MYSFLYLFFFYAFFDLIDLIDWLMDGWIDWLIVVLLHTNTRLWCIHTLLYIYDLCIYIYTYLYIYIYIFIYINTYLYIYICAILLQHTTCGLEIHQFSPRLTRFPPQAPGRPCSSWSTCTWPPALPRIDACDRPAKPWRWWRRTGENVGKKRGKKYGKTWKKKWWNSDFRWLLWICWAIFGWTLWISDGLWAFYSKRFGWCSDVVWRVFGCVFFAGIKLFWNTSEIDVTRCLRMNSSKSTASVRLEPVFKFSKQNGFGL